MISIASLAGLLFALLVPGFFITLIFFREVNWLERIMLSITFSIMLSIAIGIGLGYNKEVKDITGGINPKNVWGLELIITAIVVVLALIANRKSINLKNIRNSIKKYEPKAKLPKKEEKAEIVKFKKL